MQSPLATLDVYDGTTVVATKIIEGTDAPTGNQWHRYRLTAEITNASNHTIMIEGAETLDAIAGRLPAIVALHGRT